MSHFPWYLAWPFGKHTKYWYTWNIPQCWTGYLQEIWNVCISGLGHFDMIFTAHWFHLFCHLIDIAVSLQLALKVVCITFEGHTINDNSIKVLLVNPVEHQLMIKWQPVTKLNKHSSLWDQAWNCTQASRAPGPLPKRQSQIVQLPGSLKCATINVQAPYTDLAQVISFPAKWPSANSLIITDEAVCLSLP